MITGDDGRQMDTTSVNKDTEFSLSRKATGSKFSLQKNMSELFRQDPLYHFLLNLLLLQSQLILLLGFKQFV